MSQSPRAAGRAEVLTPVGQIDAWLAASSLIAAVELRDRYTAMHMRAVADLAAAIARELQLDDPAIVTVRIGGALHDLGKLATPLEILTRPGRLMAPEYELLKLHARAGADVIKGTGFPKGVLAAVLHHHERLDGSGYPDGLTGTAIAPEALIVAVADVVESMATARPYRPARGIAAALNEIESQQGLRYDKDVVDACLHLFHESTYRL